jgi:fatty-acyl-CoA synthase
VDVARLAAGEIADVAPDAPGAASLVSCGRPLPGVGVEVAGSHGVGELIVRSPSLTSGYVGDAGPNSSRLRDGALATGDLGFVHDGDLYVTGRADDVLTVGGTQVSARQVEVACERTGLIRRGACVLVDVTLGGERRLALVAEPVRAVTDWTAAARELTDAARRSALIHVHDCVFVERGHLPRTASGKPQRFRARALAVPGADHVTARVER